MGFENFVLFLSFIHMPGIAKVLSAKESHNLLKVLISPRDKLLFATGLYTGLRISEIIAIKQKHVCTTNDGMRNILKITRHKKKHGLFRYPNPPKTSGTAPYLQEILRPPRRARHSITLALPIHRRCGRAYITRPRPQLPHRSLRSNRHRGCLQPHNALHMPDHYIPRRHSASYHPGNLRAH